MLSPTSSLIQWKTLRFADFTAPLLYQCLKLRVDIFVVEQCCYYPELDNLDLDENTQHLIALEGDKVVGYCRILPAGLVYENYVSIGRVALAESARGKGLAHQLMQHALEIIKREFNNANIKISAQHYLEKFYQQHQFDTVSEVYLEDDIPHIAMIKINKK